MYYELNDGELKLINDVSSITGIDYCLKDNLIAAECLITAIEDLKCELNHAIEKYEDFQSDVRDNYKRISQSEQYE